MGYTRKALIAIAEAEVGYIEKKSNYDLDSKTGNAGDENYTKYARDLYNAGFYNGNKQGYPYCDVFHDWCHWKAAGENKEVAEYVICQTGDCGAGCTYSADYYRAAGRFFSDPEVGDQIFFGESGDEYHTGTVYKVDNSKVYTIEGNTSGAAGVVDNGGGVFKKWYYLNDGNISGYGRPRYDDDENACAGGCCCSKCPYFPKKDNEYTLEQFVMDVQDAIGATVDGDPGPETIGMTVTLSEYVNSTHPAVEPVQKRLYALGYTEVGEADCYAGPLFTQAVKHFQRDNGCWVDGEITACNKTWRIMLGME